MEQEAAQELLDRERQQALLIAVRGVSPAEGDVVIGEGNEAMIGDGDAMRVIRSLPMADAGASFLNPSRLQWIYPKKRDQLH